jgi:gluconokinase
LQDVRDRIGELETAGSSTVLTCSALKRSYRDLLRTGRPSVQFVHLDVDPLLLQRRLEQRRGHWMPPTLLSSQLAALEPLQPDEPGVTMPADGPVEQVVDALLGVLR